MLFDNHPPKGGKERHVPLPETVSFALAAHITKHQPVEVTLPWKSPDGPPVTASLLFVNARRQWLHQFRFDRSVWRPALTSAGIPLGRENGMHALRHFYASVLLDAGESIKALSEYLGHHDPSFTLRTYTHLMPNSEARTRAAVDRAFRTRRAPRTAPKRPPGQADRLTCDAIRTATTDRCRSSPSAMSRHVRVTRRDLVVVFADEPVGAESDERSGAVSDQKPNRRNEDRGMRNERGRAGARCLAGAVTALVVCWIPAGTAHADETNTGSHNGHRVGLLNVNVGQVDDPAEDVLEHTLLFGDGYAWN